MLVMELLHAATGGYDRGELSITTWYLRLEGRQTMLY